MGNTSASRLLKSIQKHPNRKDHLSQKLWNMLNHHHKTQGLTESQTKFFFSELYDFFLSTTTVANISSEKSSSASASENGNGNGNGNGGEKKNLHNQKKEETILFWINFFTNKDDHQLSYENFCNCIDKLVTQSLSIEALKKEVDQEAAQNEQDIEKKSEVKKVHYISGCEVDTWKPYPHPVFCVPLDTLEDNPSKVVHYFIRVVIKYLFSEALYIKHLLSIPVNSSQLEVLIRKFNTGKRVELTSETVSFGTVIGLIRYFIDNLPEPIVPQFYNIQLLYIIEEHKNPHQRSLDTINEEPEKDTAEAFVQSLLDSHNENDTSSSVSIGFDSSNEDEDKKKKDDKDSINDLKDQPKISNNDIDLDNCKEFLSDLKEVIYNLPHVNHIMFRVLILFFERYLHYHKQNNQYLNQNNDLEDSESEESIPTTNEKLKQKIILWLSTVFLCDKAFITYPLNHTEFFFPNGILLLSEEEKHKLERSIRLSVRRHSDNESQHKRVHSHRTHSHQRCDESSNSKSANPIDPSSQSSVSNSTSIDKRLLSSIKQNKKQIRTVDLKNLDQEHININIKSNTLTPHSSGKKMHRLLPLISTPPPELDKPNNAKVSILDNIKLIIKGVMEQDNYNVLKYSLKSLSVLRDQYMSNHKIKHLPVSKPLIKSETPFHILYYEDRICFHRLIKRIVKHSQVDIKRFNKEGAYYFYCAYIFHLVTKSIFLDEHDHFFRLSWAEMEWCVDITSQAEIFNSIITNEDDWTWHNVQSIGIPLLVVNSFSLKEITQTIARAELKRTKDPNMCALFYIAADKTSALANLYKSQDPKIMNFLLKFINDPTDPIMKNAARVNAYKLISSHRFLLAMAFFLLADDIMAAVNICISRLQDWQLAIFLVRVCPNNTDKDPTVLLQHVIQDLIIPQIQKEKHLIALLHNLLNKQSTLLDSPHRNNSNNNYHRNNSLNE